MTRAVLVLAVLAIGAGVRPIRVKASPARTVQAIHKLHISVWVEKDPRARALTVSVAGEAFERASSVPVQGDQSGRSFEFEWASFIPCGQYALVAMTTDTSGRQLAMAVEPLTICVPDDGGQ